MRAFVAALALSLALPAARAVAHDEPAAATPATPASATTKIPASPADMIRSGHYYLQGVMETGSELLLTQQGTFQWYFTYGALDLAARGRWRQVGNDVVLEIEEFLAPPGYETMKFQQLQLRAEGADLIPAWPWDGGAERGRYTRD